VGNFTVDNNNESTREGESSAPVIERLIRWSVVNDHPWSEVVASTQRLLHLRDEIGTPRTEIEALSVRFPKELDG